MGSFIRSYFLVTVQSELSIAHGFKELVKK